VLQLIRPTSGRVKFNGVDLCALDRKAIRRVRRRLQIVFQDSHASLNPRMPVGELIGEALDIHGLHVGPDRADRLRQLLDMVGLAGHLAERYPHELSGGQAQRVAICRALAVEPELIVCDEPVSALDVSVQAQVINLMMDLQREYRLSYLFIAHDLAVVQHISHHVAVMYLGRIVEMAQKRSLFASPQHPYSQALLDAVPVPDPERIRPIDVLAGEVPSPMRRPSGCHFHTRCPLAEERCRREVPLMREVQPDHFAACHLRPPLRGRISE
jgi:oligopeptide transport system ATP-binding protein